MSLPARDLPRHPRRLRPRTLRRVLRRARLGARRRQRGSGLLPDGGRGPLVVPDPRARRGRPHSATTVGVLRRVTRRRPRRRGGGRRRVHPRRVDRGHDPQAGRACLLGGYSGYFADPDGYVWEVAYNPGWPLDDRGLPQLGRARRLGTGQVGAPAPPVPAPPAQRDPPPQPRPAPAPRRACTPPTCIRAPCRLATPDRRPEDVPSPMPSSSTVTTTPRPAPPARRRPASWAWRTTFDTDSFTTRAARPARLLAVPRADDRDVPFELGARRLCGD